MYILHMENVIEIWKDIEGYEGLYQISSLGRVKSLNYRKSGKEGYISIYIGSHGYPSVTLSKNKKYTPLLLHRLIAQAFIPNPENKPEIDHLDGNKLNFNRNNLSWVTSKENSNNPITLNKHWSKQGIKSNFKGKIGKNCPWAKPLIQLNEKNDIIKFWYSLSDIKREVYGKTNYSITKISECCLGKRETAYGYKWKYLDDWLADWWEQEMDKVA